MSKSELIRIRITNNKEIVCTPDHLFRLRDGTYKEAKNLKENTWNGNLYELPSEKPKKVEFVGRLIEGEE